jgi:hypothetical protein
MIFTTKDGQDYLRQLQSLGAKLAVPASEDEYKVIRDLARPGDANVESLSQFKEMNWIDDKPDSVRKLAEALRLPTTPKHVIAFFPVSLEKELLRKELDYFRKNNPAGKEEEIGVTRFDLVPRRGGGYEPVVMEQSKR